MGGQRAGNEQPCDCDSFSQVASVSEISLSFRLEPEHLFPIQLFFLK